MTGTFASSDLGFEFAAKGGVGPAAPESWRRSDGVWQDNYASVSDVSDTEEWKLDASYFFTSGSLSHELEVGGRQRRFDNASTFDWPGRNLGRINTRNRSLLFAKRGIGPPTSVEYRSLWLQDTISAGRFTVNVGLRHDDQAGRNQAATVPANPAVPNVLPALDFPGADEEFDWTSVVPRLGVTAALGQRRQTLIRASLSQFVDQLSITAVQRTNPVGTSYAYFAVGFTDAPPPQDMSPYDDPSRVAFAVGFDPAAPDSLLDPDANDPGLDPPLTSELLLSLEHALRPELVVGLNLTYREVSDILEERPFGRLEGGEVRPLTADDYELVDTVSGEIPAEITGGAPLPYRRELFDVIDGIELTGGSLLTNGSRRREYLGAALTVTKRLSNRWMMRGYVNVGESEWKVDDEYRRNSDPNREAVGGDRDGDVYLTRSSGGGRGIRWVQSSFTSNLTGLLQIAPERPWGFNLSGNLQYREGSALPFRRELLLDKTAPTVLVVDRPDQFRLDDVGTIDLRVEKEFGLSGPVVLTFGVDVFNATNEGTELSRMDDLSARSAFWLLDNVSPRIYRLSTRIAWK